MLEVKGLCAGYRNKPILHQVDMTIPAGKLTVVLGPNGCGKSTLLKVLCGIIPVGGGMVLLDGKNIKDFHHGKLAQSIAYLAQSRQIPDISVRRLVLHGRFPYLEYPRRYREDDYAFANYAMEAVGIMDLADQPLQNLSGGQRQKAYIAMALAQNTPVILLDEPTTYLDISHQLQMLRQAKNLAQQGKTVVMVIHDLSHAFQVADQLILLHEGQTIAAGTPEEIYKSRIAERVFGVKLGRMQTENGWRYYCEGDSF